MANTKKSQPHKYATYSIPVELQTRFAEFCKDPILGKPRHGMQSQIVGMLLKDFLDKQDAIKAQQNPL